MRWNRPLFLLPIVLTLSAGATDLPAGYWTLERSEAILEKTEEIRLAPDLSVLSEGERAAVERLLEVGAIMQELYEISRHREAREARAKLIELHEAAPSKATVNLLTLYRLFQGPIAVTLDNEREPFLPVDPQMPGKNVYPWGITKAEIDTFLRSHETQRASILAERRVVRRASADELQRDLATLDAYPALDALHPGVRERLAALSGAPDATVLYDVPYALAWASRLFEASRLLFDAADAVEADDAEFAGYLRNRARDFLSGDYESGDASWVTGNFGRLNAQIGSYESYDDALYGTKAFHSLSLLLRNEEATRELEEGLGSLQEIEDALPYEHQKRVREDIPVGVYEVIADFGQARGTNTATILPNDPLHARRYGRIILLRENIMRHPRIFEARQRIWTTAVAPQFAGDLDSSGDFYRTLWHEVGHYLGVDRDRHGRTLDIALEAYSGSIEEMKADLVSLFAVRMLADQEMMSPEQLRSIQASGILRTLQNNRPRPDQPYQRMQLVQFNWFLEEGLLSYDHASDALSIDYERYRDAVSGLLQEVLELQHQGDAERAAAFFEQWSRWDDDLHGALAAKIRDAQTVRYRLVRYAALGE
jgi:hypothetical protein